MRIVYYIVSDTDKFVIETDAHGTITDTSTRMRRLIGHNIYNLMKAYGEHWNSIRVILVIDDRGNDIYREIKEKIR